MQRPVSVVNADHRGRELGDVPSFRRQEREARRGHHASALSKDLGEALGTAGISPVGAGTGIDEDGHGHGPRTLHDGDGCSICIDTGGTTAKSLASLSQSGDHLPQIEAKAKTAAVQGTLKERPLPRLLQQLYRKQFTGHFVIADETRDESEVYLREGSPVHICRPVDTDRLDNILVEYGLVPSEVVAEASAQVNEKQRLGDVLERMGVLNKEKLSQVLKAQVTRKLTRLFFVAEGTYAVFICPHGFGQGGDLQLMRVDPRSVIYPGIRAAYDLPRVTRELSRLADQRFRLADISPGFVAALGVPPDDATIAALRKSWMMLDDLDAVTSRPFEVRSIVLAMYYTDSLERETVPSALGSATDSVWPDSSSSSSAGGLPGVSSSPGGTYLV
jgi:hypothetical protein